MEPFTKGQSGYIALDLHFFLTYTPYKDAFFSNNP
jgi:hypothetical protein